MNIQKIASTREVVVQTMIEAAERDPSIVFVSADSLKASRGTAFAEKFPTRFFETGIAEQSAVAFAAGLASCGYTPFLITYGNFITMRACEQVRNYLGYAELNVKLVGLNGGLHGGEREGVTHQAIEDLGILRCIPGMDIVVPADAAQARHAVRALLERKGPGYVRIGSGREAVLFTDEAEFDFYRISKVRETGKNSVIFAMGPVLGRAMEAADLLEHEGIRVSVADVHTLKPLDRSGILRLVESCGSVVTVEDHSIIGGLGSAIAELMAEAGTGKKLIRLGLPDVFGQSGAAEALLDHYGMSAASIAIMVKQSLQ